MQLMPSALVFAVLVAAVSASMFLNPQPVPVALVEKADCVFNWEEHPYANPLQPHVAYVPGNPKVQGKKKKEQKKPSQRKFLNGQGAGCDSKSGQQNQNQQQQQQQQPQDQQQKQQQKPQKASMKGAGYTATIQVVSNGAGQ